jgi:MinD-like ATPase involved in chromosome partitioning or flagellar assembly
LRHYIEGRRDLKDCLIKADDNLVLGLNDCGIRKSAEMIQHERVTSIVSQLRSSLRSSVVIFDLPPMLAGDETLAFLPHVDCGLVVVESQRTTPKQIEECQSQFGDGTNFLGLVLNKCREFEESYYEY